MNLLALAQEELTTTFQRNVSLIARHLTHLLFAAMQSTGKENGTINPLILLSEIYSITKNSTLELTDADRAVACGILTGYSSQFYEQTYNHVKDNPVYIAEFDIEFSAAELFDYVKTIYKFTDRMRFHHILENFHKYGVIIHGKKYGDEAETKFIRTVRLDPRYVQAFYSKFYAEITKETIS